MKVEDPKSVAHSLIDRHGDTHALSPALGATKASLPVQPGVVTTEQMHHVADACMSAIHRAFPDRAVEGRAIGAAFVAIALDVLKELGVEKPKRIAAELIDSWSLADIAPYSRTLQ